MTAAGETTVRRLNWGCGKHPRPGWINSDAAGWFGVDYVVDILEGLPIESDSIDHAVSVHALPEIQYDDLLTALDELKRVLKPGGTLRLALPDIDKGIEAYHRGERDYFLVPDEDAKSIAARQARRAARLPSPRRRRRCKRADAGTLATTTPQAEAHRTASSAQSSIGRWRTELPLPLKRACEVAFGPALEAFGYELESRVGT